MCVRKMIQGKLITLLLTFLTVAAAAVIVRL